ncbi:hypothetical protein ACQPZZ_15270 [Microbispora sp. CA-135349]|uniref:hypothetical protein n=1 Tax=Microbispora sp. CA-135349 TaxID=3239953 RepID=UPI003D92E749
MTDHPSAEDYRGIVRLPVAPVMLFTVTVTVPLGLRVTCRPEIALEPQPVML